MAKTKTKTAKKKTPSKKKGVEPAQQEATTSKAAAKLGPTKIFDLGFNKGYQNLKIQDARLTFVRLDKFDVSENSPEKGTKSVTILIKKTKTNVDTLLKFLHLVVTQSEKIPASEKKAVFKEIASFETGMLRDGDVYVQKSTGEPYPGTPGHLMLTAKFNAFENEHGDFVSKRPLNLLRANGSTIRANEVSTELYSGIWADVECSLAGYNHKTGGAGVTCYLAGVMKLLDDESLSQMSSSLTARDDIADLNEASGDETEVPELDDYKF